MNSKSESVSTLPVLYYLLREKMKKFLICLFSFINFASAFAQSNDTGLKFTVAVDLFADIGVSEDTGATNQLAPREIEFSAFAPIDHYFDGHMTMAAHNEDGAYNFELHEAYILTSKLIPRSRLKAGQFFLGFGRLNQIHRHDWAFTSAPKIFEEIFVGEGIIDTGLEFSTILPLPFFAELTLGATHGKIADHGHSAEEHGDGDHADEHADEEEVVADVHGANEISKAPNLYARLSTFVLESQLGFNYSHRKNAEGLTTEVTGFDFVYKKRQAKVLQYLLEAEVWHQATFKLDEESDKILGGWIFAQYGFENNLQMGIKTDYFTELNVKDDHGDKVENSIVTIAPQLSWKPSEFSNFKLAYLSANHKNGSENKNVGTIELQTTFILGAHPAHTF